MTKKKLPLLEEFINESNKFKKGDKVTAFHTTRGDKGVDVTILSDFFKDNDNSDDVVAYAKDKDKNLVMVEKHDDVDMLILSTGWQDDYTQAEMDKLCKKYDCNSQEI